MMISATPEDITQIDATGARLKAVPGIRVGARPTAAEPQAAAPSGRVATVRRRPPAQEILDRALVTPGRRQPMRTYSGEVYRADGGLCPLSLRPSVRAEIKHVPLAPPTRAAERLSGHYLYAGPLFGVFGHDLIELTGRLWPLLRESFDGVVVQRWRPWIDPFQLKLDHTIATVLGAFGIGFHDIRVIENTMEVERLTVPEPALHINDFGLPILGECFRLIADHYRAPTVFTGRGFYISRTQEGSSRVANETELEEAAQRAGLQVLHPQNLALPLQISLMRQAGVLVGIDGAAMHLAAFARPGTRVLYFDTRNLANQRIVNEVAGLDARYVAVPAGGTVTAIDAHLLRVLSA